ncbi:MAG: amidohydrolase [Bacteroidia bacterium]|nr:amidohydrolase [Bacteroidia bacterium]
MLRVSLIQADLIWENPAENRRSFEEKIKALIGLTDLILLPEMFTTGFSMKPGSMAESFPGPTLDWMMEMAQKTGACVCGSVMTLEKENYYNRLFFAKPNGTYQSYNKRHLFRMAGEDLEYSAGEERLVVEWKEWKIMPLICYDLRFPVWSRNTHFGSQEKGLVYDLLLYVANWPERRNIAWKTLLPARAVENLCYVAALNRVGVDGSGLSYSGDSAIYDYLGQKISTVQPHSETIETCVLDKATLDDFRKQFPAWMDADLIR